MSIITTQIERLKKDLRQLKKEEKYMLNAQYQPTIKEILLEKQWIKESIENLQINEK